MRRPMSVAAANISDNLSGGRIQPADDPVSIDEVRGNAEPFDGALDVAAYRLELRHPFDSPPRGARPQTLEQSFDKAESSLNA